MSGTASGDATRLDTLLEPGSVIFERTAVDRFDAVRQCGEALVASGAALAPYVDSMLQRERSVSTAIGNGVALPHGTLAGKNAVLRDSLVLLAFPDGVDWEGERVRLCIGIAAAGGGHIALLSRLAELLLDERTADALVGATDETTVRSLLGGRAT